MTTEEKIEAIRQACIKANPEIVELNRDCAFNIPGSEFNPWYVGESSIPDNAEIIGRPIRLADVLLAMQGKRLVSVTEFGEFRDNEDPNSIWRKGAYWNLHNDDLTEQDEPTISFLYELLK